MTNLKTLPTEHPLRNAPLASIKAEYKYYDTKAWRPVTSGFGIAEATYNDLAPVWTDTADWRATE